MGDLSPHFSKREFTCRCRGTFAGCRTTLVLPALVAGLEALRAIGYPTGLIIRSGYRCPQRNTQVGGATLSQHLYGAAADIDPRVDLADVTALRHFSGIGWQNVRGRRLVRHVDVRHQTTGGTVDSPTTWPYT